MPGKHDRGFTSIAMYAREYGMSRHYSYVTSVGQRVGAKAARTGVATMRARQSVLSPLFRVCIAEMLNWSEEGHLATLRIGHK